MIDEARPVREHSDPESESPPDPSRLGSSTPPEDDGESEIAEAIRTLRVEFGRYWRAISRLAATKADRAKLAVRRAAMAAVAGVLGFVALSALLATASVLLLTGIAGLVQALVPGAPGLGALVAALVAFGGLAVGAVVVTRKMAKSTRERLERKYGAMHAKDMR